MRLFPLLFIFIVFIVLGSQKLLAKADDEPTGNSFLSACDDARGASRDACHTFLAGFLQGFYTSRAILLSTAAENPETASWFKSNLPPCVPEGSKTDQAYDIVINYLRAHPESRQNNLALLIWLSLSQAWPCGAPIQVDSANDKEALRKALLAIKARPEPLCIGALCMYFRSEEHSAAKP